MPARENCSPTWSEQTVRSLNWRATDGRAAVVALAARSAVLLDTARQKGKQIKNGGGECGRALFDAESVEGPAGHCWSLGPQPAVYLLANPSVAGSTRKDTGPSLPSIGGQWAESRPPEETMSGLFFALLSTPTSVSRSRHAAHSDGYQEQECSTSVGDDGIARQVR